MYKLARRSLIATRDLTAGTVPRERRTGKSPPFGIAPKHLELVVGGPAEGQRGGGGDLNWGKGWAERREKKK